MLSDTMSCPKSNCAFGLPLYDRNGYRRARSIHSFFPRNRIHIRPDDGDGGDGDDLWKCIVFGNSVGHDAHGWKLTDEDGGKKDAVLRQRRSSASLPYQDWVETQTMKLYNRISQTSTFPKNKDPYWEIIRSRHPFEPDRDPLPIPCICQDFIARAPTVICRALPQLVTTNGQKKAHGH
jgi:hypothetical protein